jgi:hypothetical protein
MINEIKGKGVFANVSMQEGEVILIDQPIFAAQFLYNKVGNIPMLQVVLFHVLNNAQMYFPACSHCMKSIETPEDMVYR